MEIRTIDCDGWVQSYESLLEVENSLEWIDITRGEYSIVCDRGIIYTWISEPSGYYGYKLVQEKENCMQAFNVLASCEDGRKASPAIVSFLKKIFS